MSDKAVEVPKAKNPDSVLDQFEAYIEIVRILRRDCPWDKKQTNQSIAHLSIEETYEMIDAIEKGDDKGFATELGDLLLHIVMHSIMAEERGAFSLIDVIKSNIHKMVTRHPHVFGDVTAESETEVLANWEQIKQKDGRKSALEGVPIAMPALLRAERIQHKAARVGFDWDQKEDVWAKVFEEMEELKEAMRNSDFQHTYSEFGDLLFALVNAARFEKIVPEDALQRTNNKFTKRFEYIEEQARKAGRSLNDMTLEEMDVYWEQAKAFDKQHK